MREWRISARQFPAGMLVAVIGIASMLFLIRTTEHAVSSYHASREVEAARKQIQDLRQQNVELQAKIARYRSDLYVEKVAREELNLVRPGDVPVIIIAPTPVPASAVRPEPSPTAVVPVPRQWLRHFLDEH
jgi:cell division protein DivIC